MILRTCDIREFILRNKRKQVVCYGAGNWLNILTDEFQFEIESVYAYAVDSNPELWGTARKVGEYAIEVRRPQFLYDNLNPDIVILITSGGYYAEIYRMLNSKTELENTECYIAPFLHSYELDKIAYGVPLVPEDFRMNREQAIPKVIHYTWFSGEPLHDNTKKCIDSWRKYAPDYDIIEWNSQNYDLTAHRYVRDAIKNKKWGFAGDYVRLDVVYRYGGFYFDLDVELLRNIDDLRFNSAFCGFETARTINLGSGFGAIKKHPLIKALRDCYDNVDFIRQDGTLNLEASPFYQTQTFIKLGATINSRFQIINDCAVYPAIYFAPKSLITGIMNTSEQSYSIHKFEGSWLTEEDWQPRNVKNSLKRLAMLNEDKIND